MFVLKNTRLGRLLAHPRTGVVYIPDRADAEAMLTACHQYLVSSGLADIRNEFVIEEVYEPQLQEM